MAPLALCGRFPADRASFIGVRIESIKFDHESVCIRLGHETHSDFWQEIRIHEGLLCEWHAEIGAALLRLAQDSPAYQKFMAEAVKQLLEGEWHESVRVVKEPPPWDA